MAKFVMTKDTPEYKAFMALWEFWKRYGTPEKSDKYWQDVIRDGSMVAQNDEYKECWDFSEEMVLAMINVLEKRAKKGEVA